MNTRLKDFISGVVFLVVMVLCGCEYQHDNIVEETSEVVMENFAEQQMGLPSGTLHGTIDLSPTTPEGKKLPTQHGEIDIKLPPVKNPPPKPKKVTQKVTKTTTPVIIEPSYNE